MDLFVAILVFPIHALSLSFQQLLHLQLDGLQNGWDGAVWPLQKLVPFPLLGGEPGDDPGPEGVCMQGLRST